jgi:fructokinase
MTNHPIIVFGEVLFDCFPDGHNLLGGAPFNVAWHLQAFKQCPLLISKTGNDELQSVIKTAMRQWKMDTGYLQEDAAYPTGKVDVNFKQGEPSYEILPDQAYDFIEPVNPELFDKAAFLYHGTLALRSPVSRKSLLLLSENRHGRVFIDVNLRTPWWDKQEVLRLLSNAAWVKMNLQELRALQDSSGDVRSTMAEFIRRFQLEGIIVTCGENGAMALNGAGNFISILPKEYVQVEDTVGAGDAFSAVFLLGLNLGWDLPLTMERAQAFAGAITERKGATVNDLAFYEPFIKAWSLS